MLTEPLRSPQKNARVHLVTLVRLKESIGEQAATAAVTLAEVCG
ncbi:MAG: hypothetical protein WBP81_15410 [Solirubrobacteraceae bacterium]